MGFRPFIFGLAARTRLCGYVLNSARGVEIEVEGKSQSIEEFLNVLKSAPPPLAVIKGIETEPVAPRGYCSFEIRSSERTEIPRVLISPDYGTCPDCLRELSDPNDRRYRYPFINCVQCGPRYTIIQRLPYDRPHTVMDAFPMCEACRREYEDPTDRRFHAEPVCCPDCGPQVWLADSAGTKMDSGDPIRRLALDLRRGTIAAVKGLGGFHLVCDATNDRVVRELRTRKARDEKPFAIMARDLDEARRIVYITDETAVLLTGNERPIVLLPKRLDNGLSESIAPQSGNLGVMLPYTPLHHLLMNEAGRALVMTSGNVADEPIAHTNDDALQRLAGIAGQFLFHDREIHIRTDDSIVRRGAGGTRFIRRSRGYAPFPVELPNEEGGPELLAVGGELKNTICVTRGRYAFLSHHIGDLRNAPAYTAFLQAIQHLSGVLKIDPQAVVCDSHPDYLSTRYAKERGIPLLQVQHHYAHIASVLAETKRTDRVIGVSFDGLGWGDDGDIWGGEFFICDLSGYERVANLRRVPLPGGDAASKRPCRMGYVYLREAYNDRCDELADELIPSVSHTERKIVSKLIGRRFQCPFTTSSGRLFDAAAALIGIRDVNTYEAQAPMELEGWALRAKEEDGFYPARIEEMEDRFVADTMDLIKGIVSNRQEGIPRAVCAMRFHLSIARLILETCKRLRDRTRLSTVALSGGVFSNIILLEKLIPLLEHEGFEILLNSMVPAGDGGLSLGQAAVAAWRLSCA